MAQSEKCPICGEYNATTVAHCHRCSYRLPWADDVEGIARTQLAENPSLLERELTGVGLLSEDTVRCRYCNEIIAINDKQCPHCQRWLVAAMNDFKLDPSQKDFRLKDVEQLDIMPVKPKFSEGVSILLSGAAFVFFLVAIFKILSLIFH